MFDKKQLDGLVKQLLDALPPNLRTISQEIEKQFHQILHTTLIKMNLVTREEFDAQICVLQHTREKLAALEKELSQYEQPQKE